MELGKHRECRALEQLLHEGHVGAEREQPRHVEVLPDEKQATTVGFLLRAVAWFDTQGMTCKRVLSDNGSAYRSKPWREACIALSLTPKRTRPYTPRTNGKAERFIKTLLAEWAYSMPFQTSGERNRWLPRFSVTAALASGVMVLVLMPS